MRYLTAMAVIVGLATAAPAHFVFVYVADGGAEARVVFGHTAVPDPDSSPARAEKTTLTIRDAAGKEAKLTVEKGDGNYYRAKFPTDGKPVVVYGTTAAGVTQRGDNPPLLSWYYPKVIIGDPFAERAAVGPTAALDVIPVRDGDKVRFKVVAAGKPVADVEVTIVPPGGGEDQSKVVKTNKDGLTDGFADRGRYCVAARHSEDKAGESGGKKYTGVRHTATVVLDFGSPTK